MEVSGQIHAPPFLFPVKNPRYSLNRKLCGPQNQDGRLREEKHLLPLQGFESQILRLIT